MPRPITFAIVALLTLGTAGCAGSGGNAERADWSATPEEIKASTSAAKVDPPGPVASLIVRAPRGDTVRITSPGVTFSGEAEPGSTVTIVDGNDDQLASLKTPTSGRWQKRVRFTLGRSSVSIVATREGLAPSPPHEAVIIRRRTEAQKARDRLAREAEEAQERADEQAEADESDDAASSQKTYTQLDDLSIKIDAALAVAVDAALGAGSADTASSRLRALYRRVRSISDALLLKEDSPYTLPANLIGGAAFNGREALGRRDASGVAKARRQLSEGRDELSQALAD